MDSTPNLQFGADTLQCENKIVSAGRLGFKGIPEVRLTNRTVVNTATSVLQPFDATTIHSTESWMVATRSVRCA